MVALDIILIIVAVLLSAGGIIGAVVPVLPGPILSWLGYLCLRFALPEKVGWTGVIITLILAIIITVIDNYIPIYGAKKLGSSKYGIYGGIIGLLIGMFFFPPIGIILGPFVGTIAGDLIAGNTIKMALKSGTGSLIGFLVGTFVKLCFSVTLIILLFFKSGGYIIDLSIQLWDYIVGLF